jgi:hypothetical protein
MHPMGAISHHIPPHGSDLALHVSHLAKHVCRMAQNVSHMAQHASCKAQHGSHTAQCGSHVAQCGSHMALYPAIREPNGTANCLGLFNIYISFEDCAHFLLQNQLICWILDRVLQLTRL